MSHTTVAIATPDLEIIEGHVTTTSRQIAEHFGKRHADVIRAIRKMEIPADYRERNFALTFNEVHGPNGATRKEPVYRITRDGFTLLAMGFTGKEAMQWKVAYITAFNKMEQELQARTTRPANPAIDYDRISPAQAQDLKELAHAIVESKVQTFAETWARLHKKFKVNSYLELPAARFEEAREYLQAKMPAPEPTSCLRATVEKVGRYENGDWGVYVVSGECGFGVRVGKKAMRPGGIKPGDLIRLEYLKKDNPLCGPFTRVILWDEYKAPAQVGNLLPEAQAKEITERLDRLGKLFHPFSDQFSDVNGVLRALRGLHPNFGAHEPSYRQMLQRLT